MTHWEKHKLSERQIAEGFWVVPTDDEFVNMVDKQLDQMNFEPHVKHYFRRLVDIIKERTCQPYS